MGNLFANDAQAFIDDWDAFGATVCDRAVVDILNSSDMEIELCFPTGAVVDEALPTAITEFAFPNENDAGIDFRLTIRASSIDGWGISVSQANDITIRDAPAVTVSVVVGWPWQDQTVVLENLGKRLYEDQTWEIVDSRLHFVNVRTYGWEPNAYGGNTLIIRNSDITGSTLGNNATIVYENSTMASAAAGENIELTIRDSVVKGDVIATENGRITLIDSLVEVQPVSGEEEMTVFGNVIATDNSRITLINTVVQGELITEGDGEILVE